MGALQLRRSSAGNSSASSPLAAVKATDEDPHSAVHRPPVKTATTPNKTSAPFPAGVVSPTMVINPGKTILPAGVFYAVKCTVAMLRSIPPTT